MSSLAAARADNFYHPPEWDPRKEGRNEYQARTGKGSAKYSGHNQYAKWGVIRFEMPFNIWCQGCGCMIAKGVRFNAKKNHVDNYHSTKIWEFVMPCHQCFNEIIVRTDPKNAEYLVTKGGRKKVEEYNALDAGTVELLDPEEREKRRADAMQSLEVVEDDKKRAKAQKGRMELLRDLSDRRKDDYRLSSMLRKKFRKRKRELVKEENEARRPGIAIKILPATVQDQKEALMVPFNKNRRSKNEEAARRVRSSLKPDRLVEKALKMGCQVNGLAPIVGGDFSGTTLGGTVKVKVKVASKKKPKKAKKKKRKKKTSSSGLSPRSQATSFRD
ncbi:hypothetical protein AAMO2058_001154500 [Amorphochlora amoebiformis]